jgi:1,4-alpha-glucan branching enzyme
VQRNSDQSDMYIPVYDFYPRGRYLQPPSEPRYVPFIEPVNKQVGDTVPVHYVTNYPSTITIYYNGRIASATSSKSVQVDYPITREGKQEIITTVANNVHSFNDTMVFFIAGATTIAPLPAGMRAGINITGDSSATLVLFAPRKNRVALIGDFNDWNTASHTMNKTPDGRYFWIQLNGLNPSTEYGYQYLVDGTIRIADFYSEKILDPDRDPEISNITYPGLKTYPAGKTTGVVSVLQTKPAAYSWKVNNFTRPDKRNLLIYELLIRDFVAAHDFKTVKDSLNYLKNLGINAIELLPVNEFEGNSSWGYNSSFYFAPDKYYGPANRLKELIDSCHSKGIAVIMDLVLNHSFGQSPMVQLYFNSTGNKPSPDNPWFNENTPHAFGFGYDFNHQSEATKDFVDRVLEFWLTEYKVDGFRLDFTKGLTQKPSTNDTEFSALDTSRVNILKRINNFIKSKSPDAYVILEHLASNDEEKILAAEGMMLWGNMNHSFNQATMGYTDNWNFAGAIHKERQFAAPLLLSYMESHDEERLMFKNIKYGNESGSYRIKTDTITSLARNELATTFYLSIPGPKMIWQFGELGYDISRCYLSTNGEDGNCNEKLSPKPIRWDYFEQPARKKLYDLHAKLMKVRKDFPQVFISGDPTYNLSGAFKVFQLAHADLNIVVAGNFGVTAANGSVTFPNAGTWYNYLNGETFTATGVQQSLTLAPGEYRYYVSKNLNNTTPTGIDDIIRNALLFKMKVYPSPGINHFLEYELPANGKVSVSVINMHGQTLSVMPLGMRGKGKYTMGLKTTSALKPGVYLIKLTLNNKPAYTRFIVQ